jgi:hypothetical protein
MALSARHLWSASRQAAAVSARAMSLQYKAPTRDIQFVLDEVLNADRHYQKVGFPDMSTDFRNSVLEEMAKFSEEVCCTYLSSLHTCHVCLLAVDELFVTHACSEAQMQYTAACHHC